MKNNASTIQYGTLQIVIYLPVIHNKEKARPQTSGKFYKTIELYMERFTYKRAFYHFISMKCISSFQNEYTRNISIVWIAYLPVVLSSSCYRKTEPHSKPLPPPLLCPWPKMHCQFLEHLVALPVKYLEYNLELYTFYIISMVKFSISDIQSYDWYFTFQYLYY